MALVTSASSTAIAPLSSLEVTGKVCSPGATAWSESISDSGEEVSAVLSPAESDWTWSSYPSGSTAKTAVEGESSAMARQQPAESPPPESPSATSRIDPSRPMRATASSSCEPAPAEPV